MHSEHAFWVCISMRSVSPPYHAHGTSNVRILQARIRHLEMQNERLLGEAAAIEALKTHADGLLNAFV